MPKNPQWIRVIANRDSNPAPGAKVSGVRKTGSPEEKITVGEDEKISENSTVPIGFIFRCS